MMTLNEAVAYGKRTGVRYYVVNVVGEQEYIVGGTTTLERAEAMKRSFEIEDKDNPWTHGESIFAIRSA